MAKTARGAFLWMGRPRLGGGGILVYDAGRSSAWPARTRFRSPRDLRTARPSDVANFKTLTQQTVARRTGVPPWTAFGPAQQGSSPRGRPARRRPSIVSAAVPLSRLHGAPPRRSRSSKLSGLVSPLRRQPFFPLSRNYTAGEPYGGSRPSRPNLTRQISIESPCVGWRAFECIFRRVDCIEEIRAEPMGADPGLAIEDPGGRHGLRGCTFHV